jgi:phosphatidylserine/phosphatidylglycerophosphate/cardiolipin synthase-like enzyme
MADDFVVDGKNAGAPFTLRAYRGDGMLLLAMDWRTGRPPDDFVGFGIEYREPDDDRWLNVQNRVTFTGVKRSPSMDAPIQKFRWVHFPHRAHLPGRFTYRVTPRFMDVSGKLRSGKAQTVRLALARETHAGKLNVAFTRGFIASQAFVDRFVKVKGSDPVPASLPSLLPTNADRGLSFQPTHPRAEEAYAWMGFEARREILGLLDEAIADPSATVKVVAYDLNEREIVERLEQLGPRLHIVIDDSVEVDRKTKLPTGHGAKGSAENAAERRLRASAGKDHVKRQHLGGLQHNKTIVVDGATKRVLCGSTNFSWRGLYVQNNNVVVLTGQTAVDRFTDAFDRYWATDSPAEFAKAPPAVWASLGLDGIDAQVTFSPHTTRSTAAHPANAVLEDIGADMRTAQSSVLYSLAFIGGRTTGAVREAVEDLTEDPKVFVYGMSDNAIGGIKVEIEGNPLPVTPAALEKNVPKPFSAEPTGGGGIRMHHKFVVIDFDRPGARVYLGSFNFSKPADTANGEHLLVVRDRRVATAYMIEAVRIFDHYQFRNRLEDQKEAAEPLALRRPPVPEPGKPLAEPWFDEYFRPGTKQRDRLLFAG